MFSQTYGSTLTVILHINIVPCCWDQIQKLAKESLVLNRAYCQQAICGPTRNSFLSKPHPFGCGLCCVAHLCPAV